MKIVTTGSIDSTPRSFKGFSRALRIALVHRVNVIACVITSFVIAVLWGGNLTAVFPVVDVIMNDQGLPAWIDQKIAESDKTAHEAGRWLAQLEELKSSPPGQIQQAIHREIKERKAEQDAYTKSIDPTGWNDAEIAEQTRFNNFISRLNELTELPDDRLLPKISQEISQTKNRQKVYTERAAQFRWFAPIAHRWLPTTPFRTLLAVCIVVLVTTLIKGIVRIWNGILVARLGHSVSHDLRVQFYQQVLRLDVANFTEAGRGDLMNRCTSDLNSVSQGVQRLFGQALLEPLKMAVCFVIAGMWVSWTLLFMTIIIAPIAGYSIHWLGRALKRAHKKAMQELSSIYETLAETLSGIKLIKAFTMEPTEGKRFHQSARVYYNRQMRIATYNSLVSPVVEMLGLAMVLIASVLGGYLVLGQQTHILGIKISNVPLTHGDMSVFFAMLIGMADPARRLSNEFSHLQQASAAADRIYEVLDREPSIVDPATPVALPKLTGLLRFENVSFHYHDDKPVLNGVNFDVRAGETIAIVGQNGCGKTTMLQLLPRFYDPTAGRITFNGTDIRDVRLRDLRMRFGLVSQEILLLNDTVASNIAYGMPDATEAEIESAAQKAHAHTFITEKLPEGYQTLVGPGGSRLSGGQRQRIALARAILRDPEILLLDEATSQIDVESEQLIFDVLQEFSRDRTTLMITHRVSMISLADRVVVMDQGKIVDHGTPDELSSRCDMYRRLCHVGYRESA